MKLIAPVLLLVWLLCGCTTYHERFTYIDPATQTTNHVVSVSHRTFLVWWQAAKLKTETQTMEFIRTVNADDLVSKPDSESIKAITDGIVSAIIQAAAAGAKP
jgi:hypothetical protein